VSCGYDVPSSNTTGDGPQRAFNMTNQNYEIIALKALGYIVSEDALRDRFVALTGLDPDTLRANLDQPGTMASILEFLISHEPDLIAAAEAQQNNPETLVKAWRGLGGGAGQEW